MSQRETSPTLAQMALDIFAIPAMAADFEKAFSLAKLTLTSQKLSMDIKTRSARVIIRVYPGNRLTERRGLTNKVINSIY